MPTLAQLRAARGISQAQLAEAIGVSQAAISNYESGTRTPRYRTARRIADYFGVSLDDLQFGPSDATGGAGGEPAVGVPDSAREEAAA